MKPVELANEARELVRILGVTGVVVEETPLGVHLAFPAGRVGGRFEHFSRLEQVYHAFGLPSAEEAWAAAV